jgi:sarcosine oxidase
METYDCIVLGVGGFGSGALYHLARRGVRVLGIERFDLAHDRGSSHGETRIIRKAYFEHPDYVPLLLRAYDLWHRLEADVSQKLLHLCGLMLAGPPTGETISGATLAAERHNIAIEQLPPAEAASRFPGFRFDDEHAVLYEAHAGFLEVENCVRAHVELAVTLGAVVKTNETVVDWSSTAGGVQVRTDRGDYEAGSLVITAGAWAVEVLSEMAIPLQVVRKPVFWHAVSSRDYDSSSGGSTFFFETPAGEFYGFPCIDGTTVKVCQHSGGAVVADPLALDREIHPTDVEPVTDFIRHSMPRLQPRPVRHSMCMYTHTPDRHFIVDVHPECPHVVIGAGFSGHGFKFTGVLGEALADLAQSGKSELPIRFLSLDRESLQGDFS